MKEKKKAKYYSIRNASSIDDIFNTPNDVIYECYEESSNSVINVSLDEDRITIQLKSGTMYYFLLKKLKKSKSLIGFTDSLMAEEWCTKAVLKAVYALLHNHKIIKIHKTNSEMKEVRKFEANEPTEEEVEKAFKEFTWPMGAEEMSDEELKDIIRLYGIHNYDGIMREVLVCIMAY